MPLGSKLPFQSKYKGKQNKTLFPDSAIDPNFKLDEKGEYIKEMIEAMYCKYVNNSLGWVDIYAKSDLLRMYGAGKQPQSIYESWAYGGSSYPTTYLQNLVNGVDMNVDAISEKLMKGWHNVNFTVVSPMSELKELIKGMLDKVDYDIHADAVDPISNDKKERERLRLLVTSKYKDWFDAQYQAMSLPNEQPEFLPKNKEELDVFESYGGLKLQNARVMQMLIRFTLDISKYDKSIREMLIDDFLDLSTAVAQDYIDLDEKRIKTKYVDAKCFFIQPSKTPDHLDSTYAGQITEYDVSYLAAMGVDRKKLESIAYEYSGLLGNPAKEDWNYYNDAVNEKSYKYDFYKVSVVEASWIEEDTKFTKWVKNRYGKVRSYEADFNYQPKKDNEWVTSYRKRFIYEGSWVIGTDVVFSFGISYNQPKKNGKLKLPFHVYKLPYVSITERCVPFLDEFMFSWLHFQNGMAIGLPDGIAVDMSMMANIEVTKGKNANLIDILNFARSERLFAYSKSITGKYEGGNPTPFSPVQGIQERIIADFNTRLDICNKNIAQITGINPMAIQGNATATTAQLNYNAMINVLKPLVKGLFSVKESAAENICWRIQNAINFDKSFKDAYSNVLSENDLQILKDSEGAGALYGIKLIARPSDEDIQNLHEDIRIAIQTGTLDIPDKMFIVEQINSNVDLRLIRMYVQSRINKNKEEQRRNQMEAIDRQNQGNLAVNQQQGQNQQQAAQIELQKSLAEIDAKGNSKIAEIEKTYDRKMEEMMIKVRAELMKSTGVK